MVIDSHVLLWWMEGGERLSPIARAVMNRPREAEERRIISHVTFWELHYKELRKQLALKRPLKEWPSVLRRMGTLELMETSLEIWLLSAELEWQHRDPADRIIAATALIHGVPVLTKDEKFHAPDSPVKAVW